MLDDDFLKWVAKMAKQPRFKTGAKDCFAMLSLKKHRLISLIHTYIMYTSYLLTIHARNTLQVAALPGRFGFF